MAWQHRIGQVQQTAMPAYEFHGSGIVIYDSDGKVALTLGFISHEAAIKAAVDLTRILKDADCVAGAR